MTKGSADPDDVADAFEFDYEVNYEKYDAGDKLDPDEGDGDADADDEEEVVVEIEDEDESDDETTVVEVDSDDDNTLPATSTFNWMLGGLMAMFAGGLGLFTRKGRKSSKDSSK